MRASLPSSCTPVTPRRLAPAVVADVVGAAEHHPPPPQPLGIADPSRASSDVAHCGHPQQLADVASAGARPLGVDVAAEARPRSARASSAIKQAELAALGRLERAERAPQQRRGGDERIGRQRRDPAVDHVEQLGVVHQHRAAAGEEALDERRPDGRRRADRQRPRQPRADQWPVPRAAVVQQPRGPALHQPVHVAALGDDGRAPPATRRGAPDGRPAPAPPARRPAARPSPPRHRRRASGTPSTTPATTRTTSPSNTARSALASVPRTSP